MKEDEPENQYFGAVESKHPYNKLEGTACAIFVL